MEQSNKFMYRVAQVLSGEYRSDDIVPVCETPELIQKIGLSDNRIVITQKHIRACLAQDTAKPGEHNHDLPIDFMDDLPKYIQSPAMILSSMTQPDSVVIVTDCKDKKDRPIIVALKNAGMGTIGGKVITCNIATSAYGRNGFSEFLCNSLKNEKLLYFDIKRSRDLVVSAGLQLPSLLANLDSNVIIRRFDKNVNIFKQKTLKKPKNFLPENYGKTLERADGLPIAYTDSDGRSRLCEYDNTSDGATFLSKSTVTLSDGRSETTEYDELGRIVQLQRCDFDGRETYLYRSRFSGESYEERTDYPSEDTAFIKLSTHRKTRQRNDVKEIWYDCDEYGNPLLSKWTEYTESGSIRRTSESRRTYDGYGNVLTEIKSDGSTTKYEYYPPSKVEDYFDYSSEDFDSGVVTHDRLKTATSRYSDGSIRIESHTLDGDHTTADYSPNGKLERFVNERGEIFRDSAAERAMFRSSGQNPPKKIASDASTSKNAEKNTNKKNAVGSKFPTQKTNDVTTVTKTVTKTTTASKPHDGKNTGRSGAGR